MKARVQNREKQKLTKRTKLTGDMIFEGTIPSRKELTTALAKQESASENLVIVERISPMFGFTKAKFTAYIYESSDAIKSIVKANLKKRHEKGTKKKDDKPAERTEEPKKEKKEEKLEKKEAPKEEKKEEKTEKKEDKK